MIFSEETITPEVAALLLKNNSKNRALRKAWVKELAGRMKRGEWRFTHQGIAIDSEGVILDGQHRLHACVLSGVPIRVLVMRGAPRESFDAIDLHKVRNFTDILGGDKAVNEVCSWLARFLWDLKSPASVGHMRVLLGAEVTSVVRCANYRAKTFSSAPVRAAAALSILFGHGESWVLGQYRALCLGNAGDLTPSGQGLLRQAYNSEVNASDRKMDLFARCMKVFDPEQSRATRLLIRDLEGQLAAVRQRALALLGGQHLAAAE